MARRGRKRKATAEREPNGQARRSYRAEPIIPDGILIQRARQIGQPVTVLSEELRAALRDETAGTVLGRLLLKGTLSQREYQAGEAIAKLWQRWASMASAPSRHATAAGGAQAGSGRDLDADEWERTDAAYKALYGRLMGLERGLYLTDLIEDLCVGDVLPIPLELGQPLAWAAVRAGLEEAARYFRVKAKVTG